MDFSNQDIRGRDFSRRYHNLANANFANATAGITTNWKRGLTVLSCILSALAGLSATYSSTIISYLIVNPAKELSLFKAFVPVILVIFIWLTLQKGWGKTLTTLAKIVIFFLLIATVFIAIMAFSFETGEGHKVALGAVFTVLGTLGIITGIVNSSIAIALGKVLFLPKPMIALITTYLVGAIIGGLCGVREIDNNTIFIVILGALSGIALGIYIGLQSMEDNQKYWLIYWLTFTLVMSKGTKFIGCNLENANFKDASLYYTDFTNAKLDGVCWEGVKGLNVTLRKITYNHEILYLNSDHYISPDLAAKAIERLSQQYSLYLEAIEAKQENKRNELKFYVIIAESLSKNKNELSKDLKDYYDNPSNSNDNSKSQGNNKLSSQIRQAQGTPNIVYNYNTFYSGDPIMNQFHNNQGNVQIQKIDQDNVVGSSINATQQVTMKENMEQIPQEEVIKILNQILELIKTFQIPPVENATKYVEEASKYVEKAKEETQEKEPNKSIVLAQLVRATTAIKQLDSTVGTVSDLTNKLKPLFEKIAPWLGKAISYFFHHYQ